MIEKKIDGYLKEDYNKAYLASTFNNNKSIKNEFDAGMNRVVKKFDDLRDEIDNLIESAIHDLSEDDADAESLEDQLYSYIKEKYGNIIEVMEG